MRATKRNRSNKSEHTFRSKGSWQSPTASVVMESHRDRLLVRLREQCGNLAGRPFAISGVWRTDDISWIPN